MKLDTLPGFSWLNHILVGPLIVVRNALHITSYDTVWRLMCVFVGFQVVQKIPATVEDLHLRWFEFIGEGMGHYLCGEGMIYPLDELIDDGRGFASQCLPHRRHILPHFLYSFLLEA